MRHGRNKPQGSSDQESGAQTESCSESTHHVGSYEQPYAGRAYIPSQGKEYKGQASDYQQDYMNTTFADFKYAKTSYRELEGSRPQSQTDYGRNQRDDRQNRPQYSGAAYTDDSPGE